VALGCVPYVLDEYAGAVYSIKVSGALAGPEGLPGTLTTLHNLTLSMCTAACSFDMLAVQPTSTLSQYLWLQLPSALNCPWNLKSELNNPVTEDLRFKFLFALLCAAPTTVIFVVKIKFTCNRPQMPRGGVKV
jgi:hypothetical protein